MITDNDDDSNDNVDYETCQQTKYKLLPFAWNNPFSKWNDLAT